MLDRIDCATASNEPHPFPGRNLVRKLLLCRLSYCNCVCISATRRRFAIDFASFVAIVHILTTHYSMRKSYYLLCCGFSREVFVLTVC